MHQDHRTPKPASGFKSQRRPTILLLMVVVALAALGLVVVRARREATARAVRLESLRAELAQAEVRLAWSEGMKRKGYASSATTKVDKVNLDRIKAEMSKLGSR